MSRLRVRIELNRGGVGVPLNKLASVVQQAQSFFRMLGDDVHIDQSQGDWLGFDFDHESLNFTAEFVGAVTAGTGRRVSCRLRRHHAFAARHHRPVCAHRRRDRGRRGDRVRPVSQRG